MKLTVIVPAFNEEAYLAPTLGSIRAAADEARGVSGADVEVIVVDNASADGTAALARSLGATVVHEPVQGIARARNAGARRAAGDVLVFVDADVDVPRTLLVVICAAMRDPACAGGGVDIDYRPRRHLVRLYLRLWRLLARATGMVQGAAQFCRKEVFAEVGGQESAPWRGLLAGWLGAQRSRRRRWAGYDESVWMGEDVDFHWSLRRLARRTGRHVRFVREPRVRPSCRRFDKWPLWKILVWTNPVVIGLFRRRKAVWRGWYSGAVR